MQKNRHLSVQSSPFFIKLFITMISLSIFPVILSTIFLTSVYQTNLKKELNVSNTDLLKQIGMSVDAVLQSVKRIPIQIQLNNTVRYFWMHDVFRDDNYIDILNNVANVATTARLDMNYIERISIYSLASDTLVYGDNALYCRYISKTSKDTIEKLKNPTGFYQWVTYPHADIFGDDIDGIQYMEFVYESINRPLGIVLVNLNTEQLYQSVYELGLRNGGYFFATNQEHKIILRDPYHPSTKIPEKIIALYQKEAISPDHDTIFIDGEEYLITSTVSSTTQFQYYFYLPTSSINYKTGFVTKMLLLICIFFIAVSVFISYLLSKNIHKPIHSLENLLAPESQTMPPLLSIQHSKQTGEFGRINSHINAILEQLDTEKNKKGEILKTNEALKQQLFENMETLRQYFLYRILYEDIETITEEIDAQATLLNITPEGFYAVFLAESNMQIKNKSISFNTEEQNKLWDGIENIMKSILSDNLEIIKIFREYHERKYRSVAILSLGNEKSLEELKEFLRSGLTYIKHFIESNFDITITISCGNIRNNISSIQKSYLDAQKALKYRFVQENDAILFHEDIEEFSNIPSFYFERKHLKNCLSTGKLSKVKAYLGNIKEYLSSSTASNANFIFRYREILETVKEYLDEIGYGNEEKREALSYAFNHFEEKFDTISSATNWIIDFVSDVYADRNEQKTGQSKWIAEALTIIAQEYHNNIGLTYLSTKLGITESYLSKLFKEELGTNFKDYLTQFRLNKAKEYLLDPTLTIAQIAEKIGYNNYNQFSKMFKKYEGVSPAEYRSTIQREK